MKWWKVILLLPLILMIKCRKLNHTQPTNITHQWETLTDSASFIILKYNYTNVTNNQSWDLLDLSEVDSLYIEISNDEIKLTRVEIVNGDSHYGWEHWDVIKEDIGVFLKRDQFLRYKVINISEEELSLEGYHTFHQELSRINALWVRR
jgi:hypothetical protein